MPNTILNKLSDKKCKSLYGTKGKVSDGGGLVLQDGRYWRLFYRFAGQQSSLALGTYPEVSLAKARELRAQVKEQIASGIDPSKARKDAKAKQRTGVLTFEKVANEWLGTKTNLADRTKQAHIYRLEKNIFPHIGNIPIATLAPSDILATIRVIEARGSLDLAHRQLTLIGQICRFAVASGYCSFDATSGLRGALKAAPPVEHHAAITDPVQVGQLLRAIDSYDKVGGYIVTRYALQIMALVFVRSKELRLAKWDEIDFGKALWTIPANRMKMRREHLVPLARQTVELFKELYAIRRSEYIFPSSQTKSACISDVGLLNALRRLDYTKEQQSIHGFRSIASTLLNEQGQFRSEVIEMQLAHVDRNHVRAAYNRAAYIEERRALMQWWADYLDRLRAGL